MLRVSRAQVVHYRMAVQGLTAEPESRPATKVEILDLGVHDAGQEGAAWALAVRGAQDMTTWPTSLTTAWTLRGAPHVFRSRQLAAVARANLPWSHSDAAYRVHDAAKPLQSAAIPVGEALANVAQELRDIVRRPLSKGEISTLLTTQASEPYVRWCAVCKATHLFEEHFRFAALPAGLVLDTGSSPPVLRPRRHWDPQIIESLRSLPESLVDGPGIPLSPTDARHDPLLAALRFFGPLSPVLAAEFLDAPIREVAARWSRLVADGTLTEVTVTRGRGRAGGPFHDERLHGPAAMRTVDLPLLEAASATGTVRLLGPYDLFLQGRDRHLLVPDPAHRTALWPGVDRPGAVVLDGEVIGTWRPQVTGDRLHLRVDPWTAWRAPLRQAVDEQAELLATHRGATYSGQA